MRRVASILLAGLAALVTTARGDAPVAEGPKRVLIVHTFGLHFEPFIQLTSTFRTELADRYPGPIEFNDISLETARFDEGPVDQPVAEYIRALSVQRRPHLVVAAGAPAFSFCQRHAGDVFQGVPILGAGIERRHTDGVNYEPGTALVNNEVQLTGIVEGILALLPETRRIYVVMGSAPLEKFWADRARKEWEGLRDRVEFVWLDDLTFQEIQGRTAALPPHSVILFALMKVDAAGVPYERNVALDRIRKSANAPIFGMFAPDVGNGTVGGRTIDVNALGLESAVVAARILRGESPGRIERVHVPPSPPTFDARELKRWGIPESRLPPGSVVLFRQPSLWSVYRAEVIALAAVFLVQTLLIVLYLGNRLRLRTARAELTERERAVQDLRGELRHAGRVSLLGQFTTSLAHELGQPLGAILRNAEAAELFLKQRPTDLDEVEAIVRDVRSDATRAGEVIARLRKMLARRDADVQPLSWPDLARDVIHIVEPEARARGVSLDVDESWGAPEVRGDRVQVQQVLLNLIANAMDAAEGVADARVAVHVRSDGNGFVECAVSDNGAGVDPTQVEHIFAPFVTSKAHGMGMGLPISCAIVEAHGGRLWAERNAVRGTTFRFTLPAERGREQHG
jgi:signal transduction histidine kinase